MSNTKTVYRFDSAGYYLGTSLAQYINDELLLPSDCTEIEPKLKDGYWFKWNGKKWTSEKIPTSCAECIGKGLTCISNGTDKHNYEVKTVLESLVANESEDYKLVVSDTFIMSIEQIDHDEEEHQKLEQAETNVTEAITLSAKTYTPAIQFRASVGQYLASGAESFRVYQEGELIAESSQFVISDAGTVSVEAYSSTAGDYIINVRRI